MQLCILKTGANTITIVDGITLDMEFRNSSTIAFTITGPNAKWTAIGLGQGMTNVDMFVLDPGSGTAQITDRFATSTSTPPVDTTSNYNLESSSLNGTTWTYVVTRDVDTGDSSQDTVISSGTYTYGSAWGPANTFVNHGTSNRTSYMVTIDTSAMTIVLGDSSSAAYLSSMFAVMLMAMLALIMNM